MAVLSSEHVAALRTQLDRGVPLPDALSSGLGATQTAEGQWRFYSDSWPGQGMDWWNKESPWRVHWQPFLPPGLFSFGEDIFGNQLVMTERRDLVYLLNHENAEAHSLYVGPVELLSTVLESGIGWIEFYDDGALHTALECGGVSGDNHLHWTTPLILGGSVTRENLSVVSRDQHHVGHAKLWAQISGLPPGTQVVAS